jgi:ArsR family transcriptional regulator, arsenate/arsenite/antimonite-responsive transcriptional repressor
VLISAYPDVIRLLVDPLRLRIVELLAEGSACVCHLVTATGAKQPTVSHHLRALREGGMVVAEPYGRFTYYRLLPEVLGATAVALAEFAERARATAANRREC